PDEPLAGVRVAEQPGVQELHRHAGRSAAGLGGASEVHHALAAGADAAEQFPAAEAGRIVRGEGNRARHSHPRPGPRIPARRPVRKLRIPPGTNPLRPASKSIGSGSPERERQGMAEIHSSISRRGAAGAVAGLVLAGCGDAGATITRLTVGTPGPDPYTLMSGTDEADVKKRPQAGGTAAGDSPGLYGGTRREATCDPQQLIAFLQANPDKARAWARVQGIPVDDIPRYVSRLTPVLLRTDTLVTNHGYRDGEPTSGPAVLQAGMGVLVNGHGVPAVKCNCGNPLTPPDKKISAE